VAEHHKVTSPQPAQTPENGYHSPTKAISTTMSAMSFKEMTAVYASIATAPPALSDSSAPLQGKTTLEKLERLYYVRQ
jgi:hypothetical protein